MERNYEDVRQPRRWAESLQVQIYELGLGTKKIIKNKIKTHINFFEICSHAPIRISAQTPPQHRRRPSRLAVDRGHRQDDRPDGQQRAPPILR